MTTTTRRQQPPITPGSGLVSTDWLPGPSDGTLSPVVVSYTDFHSNSGQDFEQIAALGMKLAQSWPIMRGAVGVWLWAKPAEWRGGSVSVWNSKADMRRFIRWPVTPQSSNSGVVGSRSFHRVGMTSDSIQPPRGFAPRSTCGRRAT